VQALQNFLGRSGAFPDKSGPQLTLSASA